MVNVQPKNKKLVDRARRIASVCAGVSYERAVELLAASGDNIKSAILMGRAGCSPAEAERLLAETGGRITQALRKARQLQG
jgi:N-acetylmuramic acid 6-phosphate etherase